MNPDFRQRLIAAITPTPLLLEAEPVTEDYV
jgi:hypothetical protein